MSSSSNLLLRSSTYDRILNVAAECLLLKGYRETRMNHIAEMAGLSRAGLYKHFPTKDSILLELNKRLMDEALEDAKAVSASKDCSLDVIRNWLTKYLDYQQSNFVRAVMVADAQQALIPGGRATGEALEKVRKALATVIRRGIKAGEIRPDINAADMAYTLQGVVFSVKRNYLAERPVIELSEMKHREMLVEVLVSGLAAD